MNPQSRWGGAVFSESSADLLEAPGTFMTGPAAGRPHERLRLDASAATTIRRNDV